MLARPAFLIVNSCLRTASMAVRVYFISNTSGVFDEMAFPSADAACESLDRNVFGASPRTATCNPFYVHHPRRSAEPFIQTGRSTRPGVSGNHEDAGMGRLQAIH